MPSGRTTSRDPGSTSGEDGLDHRHDADGPLRLECSSQRAGHLGCLLRGFDEDLDGPVASEAESPDRVVVGRQIPPRQASASLLHDHPGHVGDVTLEAAPGQVPHGGALLRHEQPGTRSAVGRSPHGHDRGERHPLAPGGERLDRCQHVADLAHGAMVARRRSFDLSAPVITSRRRRDLPAHGGAGRDRYWEDERRVPVRRACEASCALGRASAVAPEEARSRSSWWGSSPASS